MGAHVKLPNVELAITLEKKFTAYLLNAAHQEGQGKARFFRHFGFSAEKWDVWANALVTHARTHDVVRVVHTQFGVRYVVDGPLETPCGRGYEAEIFTLGGRTLDVITVTAEQVRAVDANEVMHARRMA